MKFSIEDFFSKCDHANLVTFTEEVLNGKLHFLYNVDGIESRECPKSRYLKIMSSSVFVKLLSTETAHSELHNLQIR